MTALCSVVLFYPATKYTPPMPVEPILVKCFLLAVRHASNNVFSQRFPSHSGNVIPVIGTKSGLHKFPFLRMVMFVFFENSQTA